MGGQDANAPAENIVRLVPPGGVGEGIEVAADQVLQEAVGNLTEAVVIGVHTDGSLYVATSLGGPETMATLDLAKHWMLHETAKLRGWESTCPYQE